MASTFTHDFKRFFGRGLAILLPTIVTLWLLWQAFAFVYGNVAGPINGLSRRAVVWVMPLVVDEKHQPEWFAIGDERVAQYRITQAGELRPNTSDELIRSRLRRAHLEDYWAERWYMRAMGLVVAIVLIYLAGVMLGNIVGRTIYHWVERLITRIPGFKQVYPHVKQVVDLVMGEKKMAFRQVVLVEYPSVGIWTVGFHTGESLRQIDAPAGARVASVFIPTSPTPFTGFTINVPETKIRKVEMTVEEALRFVITAGVLTPGSEPSGGGEQERLFGDQSAGADEKTTGGETGRKPA